MPSKISKNISSFKKNEVNQIFKTAKKRTRLDGLLILRANKVLDFGRILVVTPKRVCNAPKRNLIKRRIKSIFYQNKFYDGQYDWVVLVEKEALKYSFSQLKEILSNVANDKK